MKRIVKFMGLFVFFVIVCMAFAGCVIENPNKNDNNNEIATDKEPEVENKGDSETANIKSFNSSPFTAKPCAPEIADGVPKVLDFYSDGSKNYYLLDGGYLENVYINTISFANYTGVPFTFSKTQTTQEQVSRSLTEVISESYSVSETLGVKKSVSAEYGIGGNQVKSSLEVSRSFSASATAGKSTTNSTTSLCAFSESQTISATLDSGCPVGYYRFAIYGLLDVYLYCTTSVDNEQLYSLEFCVCAREKDTFLRAEYSADGKFDNSPKDDINFRKDFYKWLPLPDPEKTGLLVKKEIYNSNQSGPSIIEVKDTGVFGLADRGMDTLNLSEYKDYFDANHLFCFELKINISLKDEGFQEVYLYSGNKTTSSDNIKLANAVSDYGMVKGVKFEDEGTGEARDHYIYWYVRGDELKEKMYVRYGARGGGSDTWYRNSLHVILAVVKQYADSPKEETVLNNSNKIEVTDSGWYGLAPRDYDAIQIDSKYAKYNNDNFVYCFDVNINLHEKNDGYQEIFLYNKNVAPTTGNVEYDEATSRGLICGQQFEHDTSDSANSTTKNHSVIWSISGENLNGCSALYIRYSASGAGEDTWIKDDIKVDMKIFRIPTRAHESDAKDIISVLNS